MPIAEVVAKNLEVLRSSSEDPTLSERPLIVQAEALVGIWSELERIGDALEGLQKEHEAHFLPIREALETIADK